MDKLYMGIDAGTVSVKGVIIDKKNNIMASAYMYTNGDIVKTVKNVVKSMRKEIDLDKYQVISLGITGAFRKYVGLLLGASIIKNEINALTAGVTRMYKNVKTIFEIGGSGAKAIMLDNGVVTDYVTNTACAAGSGTFIDKMANYFKVKTNEVAKMAILSKHKINIESRCTVLAETDLLEKLQLGYEKEDILYGMCKMIVNNYVNNVVRKKNIKGPIVFVGGVSKNDLIVKMLSQMLMEKIIVLNNSHLMGAIGMAIIARDSKVEKIFDFNIDDVTIETKISSCNKCSSNCDLIKVYKNNTLIDYWGNKCSEVNELKNV